jgi:hypothetical protein
LVRAEKSVDVDAPLELRMELPPLAPGKRDSAHIWCHGRVVRTVVESDGCMEPAYAVQIDTFDFVPPSAEFLSR